MERPDRGDRGVGDVDGHGRVEVQAGGPDDHGQVRARLRDGAGALVMPHLGRLAVEPAVPVGVTADQGGAGAARWRGGRGQRGVGEADVLEDVVGGDRADAGVRDVEAVRHLAADRDQFRAHGLGQIDVWPEDPYRRGRLRGVEVAERIDAGDRGRVVGRRRRWYRQRYGACAAVRPQLGRGGVGALEEAVAVDVATDELERRALVVIRADDLEPDVPR